MLHRLTAIIVVPMINMVIITPTAVPRRITLIGTAGIGVADGIGRMEVRLFQVKAILLLLLHSTLSHLTMAA